MHYRIHFEPKGAYWCIQFQKFFTFWATVKQPSPNQKDGKRPLMVPITFPNLSDAEAFISEKGIDMAYERQNTSGFMDKVASNNVPQASPA